MIDKELYELVMERARGRCEIPWCATKRPKLEVAHLKGKQMGGSKFRDVPENLIVLCKEHHDILDGRADLMKLTFSMQHERTMLFRASVGRWWDDQR